MKTSHLNFRMKKFSSIVLVMSFNLVVVSFNVVVVVVVFTMQLLSSSEESIFENLKDLIKFVNTHVDSQDYAMIIARFKISKKDIKGKIFLRCDREEKFLSSLDRKRQHTDTRLIQCFFSIIAKLNLDINFWSLIVRDFDHNHDFFTFVSYFVLRKLVIIDEAMKFDISRQSQVQISFVKILSTLRLNNEEFIFKTRDLYNIKTKMRRTALDFLTSIQAFMKQLNETNWEFNYQQNDREKLTHFFFAKDLISFNDWSKQSKQSNIDW
jgi:hypothetical protein